MPNFCLYITTAVLAIVSSLSLYTAFFSTSQLNTEADLTVLLVLHKPLGDELLRLDREIHSHKFCRLVCGPTHSAAMHECGKGRT